MGHKHVWLSRDGACVIQNGSGDIAGKYKTPNDIAIHLCIAMDEIHNLREALVKEKAENSRLRSGPPGLGIRRV